MIVRVWQGIIVVLVFGCVIFEFAHKSIPWILLVLVLIAYNNICSELDVINARIDTISVSDSE